MKDVPLTIGPFLIDLPARTITRDGIAVAVTPKAFALLEALLDARPAAVAKEVLVARLWPDVIVEPGNLHNLVSELRKVLGPAAIRTVQRFGYALEGGSEPRWQLVGSVTIALPDGATILGRETTGSPDVSRRHARIVVDGDRPSIEDLASKNGTFVNGVRVTNAALQDGDEVLLGRARFLVRAAGSETTLTVNESRG
jgi:hypothetical protein